MHYYTLDITSSADVERVADEIRQNHGNPTVLINNAGVGSAKIILDQPVDATRKTFDVNILGHFALVKQFLPAMIESNNGHIVTVASMASIMTQTQNVDYACTKAAALAFHEGLGPLGFAANFVLSLIILRRRKGGFGVRWGWTDSISIIIACRSVRSAIQDHLSIAGKETTSRLREKSPVKPGSIVSFIDLAKLYFLHGVDEASLYTSHDRTHVMATNASLPSLEYKHEPHQHYHS